MTWVVRTRLQLLCFKAMFGPKIFTEDVIKDKLELRVTNFES